VKQKGFSAGQFLIDLAVRLHQHSEDSDGRRFDLCEDLEQYSSLAIFLKLMMEFSLPPAIIC